MNNSDRIAELEAKVKELENKLQTAAKATGQSGQVYIADWMAEDILKEWKDKNAELEAEVAKLKASENTWKGMYEKCKSQKDKASTSLFGNVSNLKAEIDRKEDVILGLKAENLRLSEQLGKCVEVVTELIDAMHRYQMDVEEEPPYAHRQMMDRAKQALLEKGR